MDNLLRKWLIEKDMQYLLKSYTDLAKPNESLYFFVQRTYKYTADLFDKEYDFWREHWDIGISEAKGED